MKQPTVAELDPYGQATLRAQRSYKLNRFLLCSQLTAMAQPMHSKLREVLRRSPMPLERILRLYFPKPWFNPLNSAVQEALYDPPVMRRFARTELHQEGAAGKSKRSLFERQRLGESLVATVHGRPASSETGISDREHYDRCTSSTRASLAPKHASSRPQSQVPKRRSRIREMQAGAETRAFLSRPCFRDLIHYECQPQPIPSKVTFAAIARRII